MLIQSGQNYVQRKFEGSGVKVVVLIDPPMGLSSHEERMRVCEKQKRRSR